MIYRSRRFCTRTLLLKMHDSVCKPIALYGSEIWGTSFVNLAHNKLFLNWDSKLCNIPTVKICKSVLELPRKANNVGALFECGQIPLTAFMYINMVRYWFRLRYMNPRRLVHRAFLEDQHLGKNCPSISFYFSTKHVMNILNISEHCSNRSDFSNVALKTLLYMNFSSLYNSQSCDPNFRTRKLQTYLSMKRESSLPSYLSEVSNRSYRKALTYLRLSCHSLLIETGRYNNIPPDSRYCIFCNNASLEDEKHFLLNCSLYADLRSSLCCSLRGLNPYISQMSAQEMFLLLFNPPLGYAKFVTKYIYECFQRRNIAFSLRSE